MIADVSFESLTACPLCSAERIGVVDPHVLLCRCDVCGLLFDNPRPSAAALTAYYSERDKYDGWLAHDTEREALWRRRLRKVRRSVSNGTLLDIGAGTGQFLHVAKRSFSTVRGTEVSGSACTIAKERYGIDLMRGDIARIDFGNDRFDVITLFHVLEHVPDPAVFLERLRDLCAPGGRLVIAVPNEVHSARARLKGFFKRVLKKAGVKRFQAYGAFGFSKISFSALHDEIHLSHFTEATIRRAVLQAGFEIVSAGLDPFYVARPPARWIETGYYLILSAIQALTGKNLYDTIWVEARCIDTQDRPVCPACGNRWTRGERMTVTPPYRIFACNSCGCVFADPMKAAAREWYKDSAMYRFEQSEVRQELRWYEKAFLKDLPHEGNGRLLNAGCGMNRFLREVSGAGYMVTAVDFNERAVAFTREKLGIHDAVAADIIEYAKTYQGKSFDVVTVFEVLEHLEDPAALVLALKRIMSHGGVLCVSVPNRRRFMPSRDPWDFPPHHLTWWDRVSITDFLARLGFSVERIAVSAVSPDEMVEKTGFLFCVPVLDRLRQRSRGITRRIVSSLHWAALKGRTVFHTVLAIAVRAMGYSGKNMYIRVQLGSNAGVGSAGIQRVGQV